MLKNHLKEVGELCSRFIRLAGISDERFLKTAELTGKLHDFGKYTSFFQKHVRGKGKNLGSLKKHSLLSAYMGGWYVYRELRDPILSALAFFSIFCHHGSLRNFEEVITSDIDPCLEHQFRSIRANMKRIEEELAEIGIAGIGDFDFDVVERMNEVYIREFGRRKKTLETCLDLMLLYSALIDADKKSASRYNIYPQRCVPFDAVERYKSLVFKSKSWINRLREEIYEKALKTLDSLRDERIITLTAPTGMGKTLTGLSLALKIRERLTNGGKIIYALPYINIIEQTHEVFSRVLSTLGIDPSPAFLLKHHHLAIPGMGEGEEVPLHTMLMLQESWDSEIIVTTFAQLLYTLAGYRNRLLKKFHNLYGSVIILDEPQTIKIEYWPFIRKLLSKFAERSGSVIISMTATQPLIFAGRGRELIGDGARYFEKLNRVRLSYIPTEMTIEEMVDKFFPEISGSQTLVVLNTIRSSKEAYWLIKDRLGNAIGLGSEEEKLLEEEAERPVIAYLSTSIVPKERIRRIKLLRRLLEEGRRVVVVSTQVIEAGVDLDFERAIRDIGPIDSIIQVAGRCNRSGKRKAGTIRVVRLVDEKGGLFAKRVYGRAHVRMAGEILAEVTRGGSRVLWESRFPTMLKKYYERAYEYMGGERMPESQKLLNFMRNFNFEGLRDFKLIDEEPTISVFVELDEEARRAFCEFRKKVEEVKSASYSEAFEKLAELRRARIKLEEYVVEVRRRGWSRGIIRIPSSRVGFEYDLETGIVEDFGWKKEIPMRI